MSPRRSGGLRRVHAASLLLGLAIMLVPLAPSVAAGWLAPAGEPYHAPEQVLVGEQMERDHLAFDGEVVAWTERAWGGYHPDQPGRLAFTSLEGPVSGGGTSDHDDPRWISSSEEASSPAVHEGFIAWRYHGLVSTSSMAGQDTELFLLDTDTWEQRKVSADKAGVSNPAFMDGALYWARSHSGAENHTIHRYNLTTGDQRAWESPVDCWVEQVEASEGVLVLRCNKVVYAWSPGSPEATRISGGAILMDAEGPWVVTTEYRANDGGRGASLYLSDVTGTIERRITSSEGREAYATLSGTLVAWADVRADDRTDDRGNVLYDIYFQDVVNRNEYKLEGTRGFTGGPVLSGETLVYNDDTGRLVVAELPPVRERLVATPEGLVEILANDDERLNVTLGSQGTATVAWDTDDDGVFETEGNLTIEVPNGTSPVAREVRGVAVDGAGRYSVVIVSPKEVYRSAMRVSDGGPASTDAEGDGTGSGPGAQTDGSAETDDDATPVREDLPTGRADTDPRGDPGGTPTGDDASRAVPWLAGAAFWLPVVLTAAWLRGVPGRSRP